MHKQSNLKLVRVEFLLAEGIEKKLAPIWQKLFQVGEAQDEYDKYIESAGNSSGRPR